jgi:hypothetical protein
VHERNPHFVGKPCAAGLNGLRILVDREHAALSTQGLEKACRVAPAPECRIDIVTTRLYGQSRERFLDKHRCVLTCHGLRPTFLGTADELRPRANSGAKRAVAALRPHLSCEPAMRCL